MGLQGALVGTPDGKWTPVAVGPYHPTDFSFTGKIETLLESPVWSVVLSLPLAVVTVVIAVSAFLARIDPDQLPIGTLIYLRRASIPVAMALSATALAAAVLQVLIFYAPYNPHDLGFFDDSVVYLLMVIASIAAFLAFLLSMVGSSVCRWPATRKLSVLAALAATVAMMVEILLVSIIWVQINVSQWFVIAGILILVMATGAALLWFLRGSQRSESELS